jgi:hypothetical protein
MRVKHSKYKNAGILFELLVRQITTDTLENNPSPARDLLHKYFVKTELGKEYKLYENLLKHKSLSESRANIVLESILESFKTLNRGVLKRQKYSLIKEIQNHYNLNEFFNHKLPNYKQHAALYTLSELSVNSINNLDQNLSNKITLLEYMSNNSSNNKQIKKEIISELDNSDKEVKLLAYKILLEKFNEKYGDLNPKQKSILKEYLNSIDNTIKLKGFYNTQILEFKSSINNQINLVTDPIIKIKLEEVSNLMVPLQKNDRVKDDHLVNLLQYCDLTQELETTHG